MNTVTTQREAARTEAIRAAEWAADCASACDWFLAHLDQLDVSGDARGLVLRDLRKELTGWAAMARANAHRQQERANTITATLAAASHPRHNQR
jgi:hypothetical protein